MSKSVISPYLTPLLRFASLPAGPQFVACASRWENRVGGFFFVFKLPRTHSCFAPGGRRRNSKHENGGSRTESPPPPAPAGSHCGCLDYSSFRKLGNSAMHPRRCLPSEGGQFNRRGNKLCEHACIIGQKQRERERERGRVFPLRKLAENFYGTAPLHPKKGIAGTKLFG